MFTGVRTTATTPLAPDLPEGGIETVTSEAKQSFAVKVMIATVLYCILLSNDANVVTYSVLT